MARAIFWQGRQVGVVDGNLYTSTRSTKTHYFVKGKGYPIQDEVLHDLLAHGVQRVRIIERGVLGTRIYESKLSQWLGAPLFEEGPHGRQRCLPLSLQERL